MSKQQWLDNGDLNPDPFYLPVEQARQLAKFVDDSAMEAEIMDLVWEGENMIPIPQSYAAIDRGGAGGGSCGVKRSSGCRQLRLVRCPGIIKILSSNCKLFLHKEQSCHESCCSFCLHI